MRKILAQTLLVILSITGFSSPASAQFEKSISVLSEYFEMLASGNYETAELMWTEAAQERAGRFDIKYTGIPLKIDAASPIVRNLDRMSGHLARTAKNQEDLKDGYSRLVFASVLNGESIEHTYYMVRGNDWYWLANAQDYFARSWPVVESQYFRIHYHPARRPNIAPPFLAEADRLLEDLASRMELSNKMLDRIEQAKIEFYFCSSDEDVTDITGHVTRGTVDLGSNDIISASFPHLHELTHLLAAIKLREQPLYTHPLFREGLAVAMGGRWGKGVEPLMDLARFLQKNGYVQIDSILTMSAFADNTGADIVYPLAGLWSRWLIENIGLDAYLALYRAFSGEFKDVYNLTAEDVKQRIVSHLGRDSWDELYQSFRDHIENRAEDQIVSGSGVDPDSKIIREEGDLIIHESDDFYSFQYQMAGTVPRTVTVLIARDSEINGAVSSLFAEHFPTGRPYDGHRLAVRFDRSEAGLYNYLSNRIIAKYIVGISSDADPSSYYDQQDGTVSFHLRKKMFGDVNLSKIDIELVTE